MEINNNDVSSINFRGGLNEDDCVMKLLKKDGVPTIEFAENISPKEAAKAIIKCFDEQIKEMMKD